MAVLILFVAAPAVAQQAAPRRSVAQPNGAPRQTAPQPGGQRAVQQAGGQAPAGAPGGAYPVRQAGGSEALPPQQAPQQQPVPPQGQPAAAVPQRAPFQLTPAQQALLDEILRKWEQQSNRISTFTCKFGRWEVNEVFGPPPNYVLSEAKGEIKFKSPGYGSYLIKEQTEWDKAKNAYTPRTEGLDHWVCDGKSIFEFNQQQKQLIERQLDPSMQGKAITDGPLPFVFGTKAEQLKRRYWMRDITATDAVGKEIWLEAWPQWQRDAANFQHAIIVLNQRDFMPNALRIVLPDGKTKQDYSFTGISVNNPVANLTGAFAAPRTPLGWSKVVIPAGGGEQVPPPGEAPAQAQQPQALQR